MSGVVVVRYLLANYAPWVALVPRTLAGPLPQGITLPAASIALVDGDDFRSIARVPAGALVMERVQVSLAADDYATVLHAMPLVPKACPNTRGTVNGIAVDSIVLDIEGGDDSDELLNLYFRTRDVIVRYWRT